MLKILRRILRKEDSIEDSVSLISINFGIPGFQQIRERTTCKREEKTNALDEEKLEKKVRDYVTECFPNSPRLSVVIIESREYIERSKNIPIYYLSVAWENGMRECAIRTRIKAAVEDYLKENHPGRNKPIIKPQLIRMFTEDVILETSKKYGECIAPNLPLNMDNIKKFRVGGVPIYDLAIGELRLKQEVV